MFLNRILTGSLLQALATRSKGSLLAGFFILFFILPAQAQEKEEQRLLMGINFLTGEAFMIHTGSLIAVEYNGYLGQKQYFKGYLKQVSDSAIVLSGREDLFSKKQQVKVNTGDITGLRHFTLGYQVTKIAVELCLLTGSAYLYTQVLSTAALTPLERLGIATGSGVVSIVLVKLIFPGKINIRKQHGWQFMTAFEPSRQK